MGFTEKDKFYIRRTIELAQHGQGFTSPNPKVGCLIEKDGHIIAEGFHHRFGAKHAEIDALDNAREPVEGATLYCNLEPCCSGIPNKKTPPCTERIIKEKIKKVIIGTRDANPYVNGKGIKELQDAGIEVIVGVEKENAYMVNEAYFKYMTTGMPFIHLKIAQSLDGRIATRIGDSKWITNGSALNLVQDMRYEADGILIGLNTVIQDNPFLTQRHYPDKQPWRIVLDEHLSIPLDVNLLTDKFVEKTLIATTADHDHESRQAIEKLGATVFICAQNEDGKVELNDMLKQLAKKSIINILVEGGSRIFTSFVHEKIVDKISLFIAPKMIGKGIETINDLGITQLSESLEFITEEIRNIEGQVLWTLYPQNQENHVYRNS